jgi:hypothetical protein
MFPPVLLDRPSDGGGLTAFIGTKIEIVPSRSSMTKIGRAATSTRIRVSVSLPTAAAKNSKNGRCLLV